MRFLFSSRFPFARDAFTIFLMAEQKESPFVQMIHRLHVEVDRGDLQLGEIFDILKDYGHSVVILFLCLPFMQPIPLPGLSTPIGALIGLSALLQAAQVDPWMPKSWRGRTLKSPVLAKIFDVAERAVIRMSRYIHPRCSFVFDLPLVAWLNAILICIAAFLLALPLPIPFSNTVPVIFIISLSLARLEKDALLLLLSYVVFALCLVFFFSLAQGVGAGWDHYKEWRWE